MFEALIKCSNCNAFVATQVFVHGQMVKAVAWASKREVKGSSHGQGKNGICVRTK